MTTAAMTAAEHRALAKKLDRIEAELAEIHAAIRASHRGASRTRIDASKAVVAVQSLRLSMVEQLAAETIDHARAVYCR